MNIFPFSPKKRVISNISLLYKRFTIESNSISGGRMRFRNQCIIAGLLLCFTFAGYAQRNKNILPLVCVKKIDAGLFQATFSYENPTRKEVVIDENGSIIKSNNGKKVTKGLNKFKPGLNKKTFTKEFGPGDFVEWTIISNGKTHTVVANGNSAYCEPDDSFIFPVIGNGKSNELSGNELLSFCLDVVGTNPPELIFQTKTDGNGILKVLVEIVPKTNLMGNVLSILRDPLGPFNIQDEDFLLDPTVYDYSSLSAIDVFIGKETVCFLNDFSNEINFARPVYPANISSGIVTSQGDGAQTSNLVRDSFRYKNGEGTIVKVDGKGITVGVMSDSYDTNAPGSAQDDINNRELPGEGNDQFPEAVNILKDNTFKASDEGRAMLQIVHDVAPGAKLQFHTAVASPRQFEVGYNALAEECDIIVDDITFITEPFFGTSRITDAINASGKIHVTSAGNIANRGFQSTFNLAASTLVTNFIEPGGLTVAHDFDDGIGVDYLQKISVVPGTYLIALQWKEEVASQGSPEGASVDLDIYIVDDVGRLLVGNNRKNIKGDPTEVIVFRATGTGEANILITSANGDTAVPFRYIAFQTSDADGNPDGLKIKDFFGEGAPTVSGHAMNAASTTVGAVDYRFANDPEPAVEYFSSYAGSLSDDTVLEIDLYAPDGGNTSVETIGQYALTCTDCDGDAFKNFYGTSAAAPHFAGAAALLMSAAQAWFPPSVEELALNSVLKTTYTASDALQVFKNTARPLSTPDGSAGGLLNTLAAFKSIAAQTAKITELIVEDGKTPSAEPFTVTIIGEFFPESIEDVSVLFDGQPLENIAFATGENGTPVITASVPIFTGNPEVLLEVRSKTEGDDGKGGLPAYFFKDGKIALNIIANNDSFEYGQDIGTTYYRPDSTDPDYVPPYTVEGLPEGVTFESLALLDGLPPIVLSNASIDVKLDASEYPDAFIYSITPSFGDEVLNETQLAKYQINFISGYQDDVLGELGILKITKKELTITSAPVTTTYGEAIIVPLEYEYDATGITNDDDFRAYIANSHSTDFFEENRLALINKYTALISKYPALISTLSGGSWVASEQTLTSKYTALISKYPALISNMGIVNLDEDHFDNYYAANDAYGDGSIVSKYPALISKYTALISAEDLAGGYVQLNNSIENSDGTITNKLNALISKYPALISKYTALISAENGESDYESIFAIVADDEPLNGEVDDQGNDVMEIPKLYALNMITGLDVTIDEEGHLVYPGAFLNSASNNFITKYVPGTATILPATLTVKTTDLTIPYGQILTKESLETSFNGFAFDEPNQESVETVFPEADGGILYYFIKVGGDGSELTIENLKELGEYNIKIRDPQNYVIQYIDDSPATLTIEAAPLSFNPIAMTIKYGETPVINPDPIENSVFTGFVYGEGEAVLNSTDGTIPYYFVKVDGDGTRYTMGGDDKMGKGVYTIFLEDDLLDNYMIVPVDGRGTLTITEATLKFDPGTYNYKYGQIPDIDPESISGFAYDDDANILNDVSGNKPYYYVKVDGDGTEFTSGMGKGVYDIFLTDLLENYNMDDLTSLGQLTVMPLDVIVKTPNLKKIYGYTLKSTDITTDFEAFAYGETVEDVFGSSVVPYYLEDTDGEYEINATIDVGTYDIRIRETNANYIFDFDSAFNVFEVTKRILTASIDDLIINQGDTPVFSSSFSGNLPGEPIFTDGIAYYIVDESNIEHDYNDPGVFIIKIRDPENYTIIYDRVAKLFISDYANKKIRTYADCVSYDPDANDGLNYTVIFRYENDNDNPVYVFEGERNYLTGNGQYEEGILPTTFMPGTGTFKIRFDGNRLTWSLETFGSLNNSSVSSANNDGTGECAAKVEYLLYPNPVSNELFIEQNETEASIVNIMNIFGAPMALYPKGGTNEFDGINRTIIEFDVSSYEPGMYIVRIEGAGNVRTFNIIKQ